MIKKIYVKTMNKLFRKDIWRVFVIHIEHNEKMKKLKVVSVEDIDLPGTINGYCHVWSKIIEDMDKKYKAVPVVLMDHIYGHPVAHFLVTEDDEVFIDGADDDPKLLNSIIKEDKIRYFRFPSEIEKLIIKHNSPNNRLIELKLLMEQIYREKASPFRKLLWKLLPLRHRVRFF